MSITKNLRLVFIDSIGKMRAVTIANPVESPGEQLIEDTMDHIIDKDVFQTTGGSLVEKVRAEIVERSVDEVFSA